MVSTLERNLLTARRGLRLASLNTRNALNWRITTQTRGLIRDVSTPTPVRGWRRRQRAGFGTGWPGFGVRSSVAAGWYRSLCVGADTGEIK